MHEVKSVIFDWSGTISDDFGVLYEIVMEIFEEHGVKRVSREDFLAAYTLPYMASINQFFAVTKEEWDGKFKKKWTEKGRPNLLPNAKETLDYLKSKGIVMHVFTSHPENFIMREIDDYGLHGYFTKIFAGHYDKKDAVLSVISTLNVRPETLLYVGDTTHDMEAGKHAGIKTAAVLSGYNSEESLRALNPTFVFKNISELKNFF